LENCQEYGIFDIINDIENFKDSSDIILANRFDEELKSAHKKVFTRDLFNKD